MEQRYTSMCGVAVTYLENSPRWWLFLLEAILLASSFSADLEPDCFAAMRMVSSQVMMEAVLILLINSPHLKTDSMSNL